MWNIGGKNINDYFAFLDAVEIAKKNDDDFDLMEDGILTYARLHDLPEVGAHA